MHITENNIKCHFIAICERKWTFGALTKIMTEILITETCYFLQIIITAIANSTICPQNNIYIMKVDVMKGVKTSLNIIEKDIPIVGIVVTISPSFSLYKIVVFPAASSPTIK